MLTELKNLAIIKSGLIIAKAGTPNTGNGSAGQTEARNILNQLPDSIKKALGTVYWVVFFSVAVFFGVKAITNVIKYFNGDDDREKREYKRAAISNIIGMVVAIASGTLLNALFRAMGLDFASGIF